MVLVKQVRGGVYVNKNSRSNVTIPEAEWLLSCVRSDKAIAETPGDSNIRPYMANYAAMGLARAYEFIGNSRYLQPVWGWLEWYRDHMDPTTGYVDDYTVGEVVQSFLPFNDNFNRADGDLASPWFYETYRSHAQISGNKVISTSGAGAAALALGADNFQLEFDWQYGNIIGVIFCAPAEGGIPLAGKSWYQINIGGGGNSTFYHWDGSSYVALDYVPGGTFPMSSPTHIVVNVNNGVLQVTIGGHTWTTAYTPIPGQQTMEILHGDTIGWFDNVSVTAIGAPSSGSTPPDSTDAYAGTYLVALALAYNAAPDGDAKLVPFYDSIPLALTAIESTQQSDGLTYALPTYDVKYLEDNIETLAGAQAAVTLAALPAVITAKPGLLTRAQTTADAMAKGLGYMWNHDAGTWDYAIHSNRVYAHNDWSDENAQRQQIWANAWGALPSVGEAQAMLAAYSQALPTWSSKTSSYEPLPVWAYRNANQGNTANSGASNLEASGVAQARAYPWTCQTSGAVLIGLLGFSLAMPWAKVMFPSGENLIPDPQFLIDSNDNGRADVFTSSYGDPTSSLHPLTSGGNYQHLDTPDGNVQAVDWADIPVEENTYVTFSFWYRITRLGPGGGCNIKYEVNDSNHAFVNYGYNSKNELSGPEFSRWYINAWIPPGVAFIKPIVEIGSGAIDVAYPQVEVSGSPTAPPYGVPVPGYF